MNKQMIMAAITMAGMVTVIGGCAPQVETKILVKRPPLEDCDDVILVSSDAYKKSWKKLGTMRVENATLMTVRPMAPVEVLNFGCRIGANRYILSFSAAKTTYTYYFDGD